MSLSKNMRGKIFFLISFINGRNAYLQQAISNKETYYKWIIGLLFYVCLIMKLKIKSENFKRHIENALQYDKQLSMQIISSPPRPSKIITFQRFQTARKRMSNGLMLNSVPECIITDKIKSLIKVIILLTCVNYHLSTVSCLNLVLN